MIKSVVHDEIPTTVTSGLASLLKSGVSKIVEYASLHLENSIQLIVNMNFIFLF